MTNTTRLTDVQANTLRKILALGGAARGSRGRLGKTTIHDGTLVRLEKANLVEIVCRYVQPQHVVPTVVGVYATAAGCLALRAYEVAKAS